MRDKIIDRVKKMLAKADPGSNNYVAEMEVAASMAKKLIAEHKITQAELDARDNLNAAGLAEKLAYTGKLSIWMENLVVVVEQLTGTKAIVQHRESDPENKRVVYIGSNIFVDLAIELFNKFFWIIAERAEQTTGLYDPINDHDIFAAIQNAAFGQSSAPIDKKKSFDSYALGFVHKLLVRAEQKVKMETPEAQQKHELMVVEEAAAITEFIKDKYNPPEPKSKPILHGDRMAYLKGFLDASNESLDVNKAIK